MNVLIVDDERLAVGRLHQMLNKIPGCNCVGCALDGIEAIQKTRLLSIDLILMDIRMPKMDGLTAARHIRSMENPPAIIFTTSFAEYSLQAFSVPASGYLLKPVTQPKLMAAIRNINDTPLRSVNEPVQTRLPDTNEEYICCRHCGEFMLVALSKIYYLESSTKYTRMYYHGSSSLTERPLKSFLEYYPDQLLCINRGTAINRSYLRGLCRAGSDQYEAILMETERKLPVSRRKLASVRACLKQIGRPVPLVSNLPGSAAV